MRRTAALAVVVLSAALTGAYLAGSARGPALARAAGQPAPTADQGIVVSGVGRVSGVPDVLRASLGVNVHGGDVSSALRAANAAQSAVTAAVRHDGVADRDIATSDVSIDQSYDNRGRLDGYQVSEQVTIKLRNLTDAGRTLGDAVNAGGSAARLSGVSFALEDNAALLVQARQAAYDEAKAKAQKYADLAGRPLGAVQLVSEVQSDPQPVTFDRRLTAAAPATPSGLAVPISPGQSEVTVSVTVRWALA